MAASNFEFLQDVNDTLYTIALSAESNLHQDPHTTLFKIRVLSEEIVNFIAQLVNLEPGLSTFEQLKQLGAKGYMDEECLNIFHVLRKHGNKAAHSYYNNPVAASHALEIAHKAATIYARVEKKDGSFNPPAYSPPKPQQLEQLDEQSNKEIARLKSIIAELKSQKSSQFEVVKNKISMLEAKDSSSFVSAQERVRELENQQYQTQFETPSDDEKLKAQELKQRVELLKNSRLDLTEPQTRFIIDQQLRDAKWDADTVSLNYKIGTRPEKRRKKN